MTPEERADALADELLARGKVPILTRDARAIIASAIRDAEGAAYELSAQVVDHGLGLTATSLARHIRALKSKGT